MSNIAPEGVSEDEVPEVVVATATIDSNFLAYLEHEDDPDLEVLEDDLGERIVWHEKSRQTFRIGQTIGKTNKNNITAIFTEENNNE